MEKIGKYKIIGELGKGAMGIVYKGIDPDINREVAIKLIRFDMVSEDSEKEDAARRFIREAQSAGNLEHPNIITIYEVGREDNQTFIVMQYVDGESLKQAISAGKRFSPVEVVDLMTCLCDALELAHQNKIVHRDIKPGNILLDKQGRPYLVDFGVARMEMSTMTQSGTIVGTPSYMSPEQIQGIRVDSRADIFSLGVIIYEMLTGKRPFEGDHITTIVYKIMNEEPTNIREMKKDLPDGFEQVINKALEKDSNKRYQSCKELAADLKNIGAWSDRTISSGLQRSEVLGLQKKGKQRRALVYVASLVILLLAGAVGAYYLVPDLKENLALFKKQKEIAVDVTPLPARQLEDILDVFDENLVKIKELIDKEDFRAAVILAEQILVDDADNAKVKSYLELSKTKMNEMNAAALLRTGKNHYNQGNYEMCQETMREVLRQDANNEEARRYINLSIQKVAEAEIRIIVERHKKAEQEKDLLTLLSDIGLPTLSQQRTVEARELFNNYDDIQAFVSKISVRFTNNNRAVVTFPSLVSAVPKATGRKKVIFEGDVSLTMEKQGDAWKIVGYSKTSI
ncbi:MAG TPA: serine/threonine-protein kinase [Candidatus Heimdallarchaeota archaeon]|nr:serine/threonine-protein kinase [Candidatus Heimdallarchaeota archaeon]